MRLVCKLIATAVVDTISYRALRKMSSKSSLSKQVLSIQSHVVHGYVGNKSATFPLQLLGFEVDAINSVQFSNHTGYKTVKGEVLDEQKLNEVFEGLVANNLHSMYSHLLTGYTGNVNFLRRIAEIVKSLRAVNPDLVFLCDPVMGDDDFMYVPKELLPVYRDEIVPLANITTPNQFELELLTEIKVKQEEDVWKGCQWFHDRNIETVVLSSTTLGDDKHLLAYLSYKNPNGELERYRFPIPKLTGIRFTGTGDLFAALFMAHRTNNPNNIKLAFENTVSTLQAVLHKTIDTLPEDVRTHQRKALPWERELKIIQCKNEIEHPVQNLFAEKL